MGAGPIVAVGGGCCADKAAIRRIGTSRTGKIRTKSVRRLREQFRFVSGHRFSDADNSSKSEAPLGAARRKFSTISAVLVRRKLTADYHTSLATHES